VKIFDQAYNGNGTLTIPIAANGFTVRILFTGTVVPFSGPSEWIVRSSAGGTTGYSSFLTGEGAITITAAPPTQPGFIMGRTGDQSPTAVSFEYVLSELPDAGGLLGHGQGTARTGSGPILFRTGGTNDYTGTSTSLTIAFWNTSNVTGRFVALELM
jgi:hypothetical protein